MFCLKDTFLNKLFQLLTMINYKDAKIIEAKYNDLEEFQLDPKGYFLIRINKEKQIEVGFCKKDNKIEIIIKGKTPIEIYQTILRENIIQKPDHAAYLGRELQKAYIALKQNKEYIQDEELDFNKCHS